MNRKDFRIKANSEGIFKNDLLGIEEILSMEGPFWDIAMDCIVDALNEDDFNFAAYVYRDEDPKDAVARTLYNAYKQDPQSIENFNNWFENGYIDEAIVIALMYMIGFGIGEDDDELIEELINLDALPIEIIRDGKVVVTINEEFLHDYFLYKKIALN